MSEVNIPAGMVLVDDYSKAKGENRVDVINKIRDGVYNGKFVNDDWYILDKDISEATKNSVKHTEQNNPVDQSIINNVPSKSQYVVVRGICSFFSFIGWLTFILGAIFAVFGIVDIMSYKITVNIMVIVTGIGSAVSGLFLVAAGQFTLATVDNADNTREILQIMRKNYSS